MIRGIDILEVLNDLLFPKNIKCIICNKEIFQNRTYSLCEHCRSKLTFLEGNNCRYCSRLTYNDYDVCTECEKNKYYFKKGISVLSYGKYAKKMIIKLKYGKKRYISNYFSRMIYDKIIKRDKFKFECITYVPISRKKHIKRGFNHSELIAKYLAELADKKLVHILKKVKNTPDMKNLSKAQRKTNIKGVFKINRDIQDIENILIIDDVFTTGTTLNECSRVLFEKGIHNIYVATVAVGNIED